MKILYLWDKGQECEKNPTALKTRNGSKIGSFLALMIFGMAMLMPSTMNAQVPGTVEDAFDLPPKERCTSNDLAVVSARLDLNNCDCDLGDIVYATLILGIDNNTESTRTSFAFWSRLTLTSDDPNTEDIVYFLRGCQGPIPKGSLAPPDGVTEMDFENLEILTYNEGTGEFDIVLDADLNPLHQIPYVCGTTLKLSNIYEAWTDASTNASRQCPAVLENSDKINPKCGVLPELEVTVGLTVNANYTDVTCNDEDGTSDDGSVTLTFSGGTAPYYVSFDGGSYTEESSPKTYTGLSADTYSWIVKDSSSPTCEKPGSTIISNPDPFSASATGTDVSCNDEDGTSDDGSIDVTLTNGVAPFTYDWDDDSLDGTEDPSGLAAGTYNVTITDANGCKAYASYQVMLPDAFSASATGTDVTCNDEDGTSDDGSIDVTLTNGESPFDYDWDDDSLDGTEDPSGLAAGTYNVTITDANGCKAYASYEVLLPDAFSASAIGNDESCDYNDGSIDVTLTNGVGPFTYDWNDDSLDGTEDPSGLSAGTYDVIITDANGCKAYASATINGPGNCVTDQGCTLGYWKEHTDRWCEGYTTCTKYGDVFEDAPGKFKNISLLDGLNLGGNSDGENLVRQSIAALLNACSGEVGFILSVNALKLAVNLAWTNGTYNTYAITLDGYNQAGCPLGGTNATTAPNGDCRVSGPQKLSSTDAQLADAEQVSVSPVPFRESLNVQYNFDYVSDATIQIYDLQGRLLSSQKEANASKGKITNLSINFRTLPSQVYVIRVITDRDVFTKKIVSDK